MGRGTIQGFWTRCKPYVAQFLGDWGLLAMVLLVAFGSFALGRLSALVEARPVIAISEAAAAPAGLHMALGGLYVASRTGTVYYYPWCAGALKIRPESQRWFATEKEAQAAGYKPAKACKGLDGGGQ